MTNLFRHSSKRPLKKGISAILAAAITAGMTFAGTAGLTSVKAADNKALALPIQFIGISNDYDKDFESSSRLYFDGSAEPVKFSENYTYSCTAYVPKAVFHTPGSTVKLYSWFDFNTIPEEEGQEGTHYSMDTRYDISLVCEKGNVRIYVRDRQNDWNLLDENAYAAFISLDSAGDFYKVTVKDAPAINTFSTDDGEEQPIDTSKSGGIGMQLRFVGLYNEISSVAYVDDLAIKSADGVLLQCDCSDESLEAAPYYDYVIAEKDETCVNRPAPVTLETKLLSLSKSSAKVKVGKTVSIKASAAASGKITYKSSNKKVATVNASGKVKGVKAGTAEIVVSANGVSKVFKVTVK